jgi:RNA polymerase sigma factor (sigma-70 family)
VVAIYVWMMTDSELLQQYAREGREDAFAELTGRYLDLVYSAALRQVRSEELAEDVVQAVFIDLARAAGKLGASTVLAAWLYRVTRCKSIDTIRRESRRQLREQIAVTDMSLNAASWNEIEPLLDDAMDSLDETDRAVILLRYFENKTLRDVAGAIGISEDAAQKRVSRAVDRLREFFAREGAMTEGASLVGLISSHAIRPAPAALKTAILPASVAGFTKTIAMTTMQKICVAAALAATIGTTCFEAREVSALTDQVQTMRGHAAPIEARNGELSGELADANRRLAFLQSENSRLQSNSADLARLRGEVSLLRADRNDPTASAAKEWLARVNQLKARLDQTPGAKIPEMKYLTESDWLNAARENLTSDEDFRRAMSGLRSAGEYDLANTFLKPALDKYLAVNGSYPASLSDLQQYFSSPVDSAALERWEIAPKSTVPSVGVGPTIITQAAPVDEGYDSRIVIGKDGTASSSGLSAWEPDAMALLGPVFQAYQSANNGATPENVSQLAPYATTPEQQAALQKAMEMKSGNSASSQRNP